MITFIQNISFAENMIRSIWIERKAKTKDQESQYVVHFYSFIPFPSSFFMVGAKCMILYRIRSHIWMAEYWQVDMIGFHHSSPFSSSILYLWCTVQSLLFSQKKRHILFGPLWNFIRNLPLKFYLMFEMLHLPLICIFVFSWFLCYLFLLIM